MAKNINCFLCKLQTTNPDHENGIVTIAKLLHSYKEILIYSTEDLKELTKDCNTFCAQQMLEMHSLIKMLVKLKDKRKNKKDIQNDPYLQTLLALENLASRDELRSDLMKEGALKIFIEGTEIHETVEKCGLAALAICDCLNYMHKWSNYGVSKSSGLKPLLEVLRIKELKRIHAHVIKSLLPLCCYQPGVSEVLLNLDILQILIQYLKNLTRLKIMNPRSCLNTLELGARDIGQHVLELLIDLSYTEEKTYYELANFHFFSVLLDYSVIGIQYNLNAVKLLVNLVNNQHTFEKLIKNGFVHEVEIRNAQHKNCVVCVLLLDAISTEANSYHGINSLCQILYTADESSKMKALHVIIKFGLKKRYLFKTIIECKGLSLLLENIRGYDETCSRARISLCQLYQMLIKSKNSNPTDNCCISRSCCSMSSLRCSYESIIPDVTFCVDDMKIPACRETICNNSDYFTALLKGHFSESSKNVITMNGIPYKILAIFFHFLHGCNTCPYIQRISFAIWLELLNYCDKFLFLSIKTYVEDMLCHNLHHGTVSKIYRRGKQYNSPALCKKALNFVLCIDISERQNLMRCFDNLLCLGLEVYKDVLTEIRLLIESAFSEVILDGSSIS